MCVYEHKVKKDIHQIINAGYLRGWGVDRCD